MSDVYDVIYAPVVTEKSAYAIENDNIYTFIVNRKANKIEISRAIEGISMTRAVVYCGASAGQTTGSDNNQHAGLASMSLDQPELS